MNRNIITIIVGLILLLGACSPRTAPTVDPAQIQASAVAMAGTMFSQTQTAVPTLTATPLPSPTTVPSLTPALVDTPIPVVLEVSPTSAASTDPCNGPLFANHAGDGGKTDKKATILIKNSTRAPATVSLYLSKNSFGQCGFVSYVLNPNQSVLSAGELPYGCYFASAYVNDPKKPSRPTGDSTCITGDDKTTITVYADFIKITGP